MSELPDVPPTSTDPTIALGCGHRVPIPWDVEPHIAASLVAHHLEECPSAPRDAAGSAAWAARRWEASR